MWTTSIICCLRKTYISSPQREEKMKTQFWVHQEFGTRNISQIYKIFVTAGGLNSWGAAYIWQSQNLTLIKYQVRDTLLSVNVCMLDYEGDPHTTEGLREAIKPGGKIQCSVVFWSSGFWAGPPGFPPETLLQMAPASTVLSD